jgi:sec-independent protein translocase protein TatA
VPEVGVPEILIIIAVIAVVFGASRVADLGGALGRGIREFRRALREDDDDEPTADSSKPSSDSA